MQTDNENQKGLDKDLDALRQKEAENSTGSFAGTNPDRNPDDQLQNNQENPIDAGEAQNVTDGTERISGSEAEKATRKATEGRRQGREES